MEKSKQLNKLVQKYATKYTVDKNIQSNNPPGYYPVAKDMAVVGSHCGSYESLCKLIKNGFRFADRIFIMTPWANYVIFRGFDKFEKIYHLAKASTKHVEHFRRMDLSCGTAGLKEFSCIHDVVSKMIEKNKKK